MISICIPVYNFDVRSLVSALIQQGQKLDEGFEIIAIDDCSNEHYKTINEKILSQVNYIQLEKNIGRSKIRNLFLNYTQFENLLFLDCDSYIISDFFLENYLTKIKKNNFQIVFGGRIYPDKCPSRKQKLSWKYGSLIESKNAETRKKRPNKSFMTNNFLIKKSLLEKIKFDENLIKYGHEDTLFGFELMLNNVEIKHIENPILNGDIETNEVYLRKTEQGINNLIFILENSNKKELFIKNVSLLKYYSKLKTKKLLIIYKLIYFLLQFPIQFLLKQGFVNLKLFNFYKLGYFLQHYK